jgi:hypothetical protein
MPIWAQHLLVLLLVGACVAYALWGAITALMGKRSKLGSCCAKGCESVETSAKPQAAAPRVHFLPAELLGKRRQRP